MIDFGIITAPRKQSTVQQSLDSALACGMEDITVFAEPGVEELNGKHKRINNKDRLGAFNNHHSALKHLLTGHNPYVCVLLDDMIYSRNAYAIVLKALEEDKMPFGYYAMITINHDVNNEGISGSGWKQTNAGWDCWGGLFVMRKDIARKLIAHPFYDNHLKTYTANQQIDACISETFKRMELPMYMHLPSLAQHIGETSTIGHGELTDARKAYQFNPEL